jgi:hypothetical protein
MYEWHALNAPNVFSFVAKTCVLSSSCYYYYYYYYWQLRSCVMIEASMEIILEIHSRGSVRMLNIGTIITVFILIYIYIYIYLWWFCYRFFCYGNLYVSTFYLRIRLAYFNIIFIIIIIFISIFTTIIYQSALSRWDVWASVKLIHFVAEVQKYIPVVLLSSCCNLLNCVSQFWSPVFLYASRLTWEYAVGKLLTDI